MEKVQIGGFGDPNGVPAQGKGQGRLLVAKMGAFDLPAGAGNGNGAGGSRGVRGTMASAGFGNGVATPGQGDDNYSPVVETYFQAMKPDPQLGAVPVADKYFLGRMDLMHASEASYLGTPSRFKRLLGTLTQAYSLRLNPAGFAWMIYADRDEFDRQHYELHYVRREFLGDLRCLVFDVQPKPKMGMDASGLDASLAGSGRRTRATTSCA